MPKQKKRLLPILIVLLLMFVGMTSGLFFAISPPPNVNDVQVVIPKGSSLRKISQILAENKLIRHPLIFEMYGRIMLQDEQLDAGQYQIFAGSSLQKILNTLKQGSDDVWITVPEGLRAEEVGELLANTLPNFDITTNDYKTECLNYNGQLFPETYLWPREFNTAQACKAMRNEFAKRFPDISAEQLVLASLVEREASGNDDRALIAGVMQNRLEIGMALQIDATLQYAKGKNQQGEWWSPPIAADKEIPSPYNTYANSGLPPRPIANPGSLAINAALNPAETEYLFYLHDTIGQVHFAKTYQEHQANVTKFLN